MTSRRLMDAYKAVKYWCDGYSHALWFRSREVLHTEEQRQVIREAEALVMEAQRKLDSIFGPEIGRAMMREAR